MRQASDVLSGYPSASIKEAMQPGYCATISHPCQRLAGSLQR